MFNAGDLVTIRYISDRKYTEVTDRLRSKVTSGGIYMVIQKIEPLRGCQRQAKIDRDMHHSYRGWRQGRGKREESGPSPHHKYWLEMDDYSKEWFYEEELELVFTV